MDEKRKLKVSRIHLPRIKDAISCIRGVISIKPVPEDIPQHIAEERIANEFYEKFNELHTEIIKFLCERIARGRKHRTDTQSIQKYMSEHVEIEK